MACQASQLVAGKYEIGMMYYLRVKVALNE
jgi:hypothetical protein